MKRCPNCQKEYADSMRFCQTDGTPLVEAAENAPPPDPYKTVVGGMIKMDDDLLQLPDPPDPMKTMISPMSAPKVEAPRAEPPKPASEPIPAAPIQENKAPEMPKVDAPSSPPPGFSDSKPTPPPMNSSPGPMSGSEPPKTDSAPPPKPFNDIPKIDSAPAKFNSPYTSGETPKSDSPFNKPSNAPGASPFDRPSNAPSSASPFEKSPPPPYKEPEQFGGAQPPPFGNSPFQQPQVPFGQSNEPANDPFKQDSWTPPPAPVASWQDQGLGADTPFQPPVAGGQNNTLALVSLVLGILSFVCSLSIVAAIPAIITGYMQRNNIKNNPSQYGGSGMAMAGMILGGINLVLTVVIFIIYAILIFANTR